MSASDTLLSLLPSSDFYEQSDDVRNILEGFGKTFDYYIEKIKDAHQDRLPHTAGENALWNYFNSLALSSKHKAIILDVLADMDDDAKIKSLREIITFFYYNPNVNNEEDFIKYFNMFTYGFDVYDIVFRPADEVSRYYLTKFGEKFVTNNNHYYFYVTVWYNNYNSSNNNLSSFRSSMWNLLNFVFTPYRALKTALLKREP